MATFPIAADMRRPVPRVEAGQYRTARAAEIGTEGAQTAFAQGTALRETARDIDALGQTLDTAAAQSAINQLRTRRQELTYDPEKGLQRIKGGQVLEKGPDGKPLLQSLPAAFKAQSDEIEGRILSPRARAIYQQVAANEQRQYQHDVTVHFARQTEQFEAATYKDATLLDQAEAAKAFTEPAKVEAIAKRQADRAMLYANQRGLPGEGAAIAARSNVYRVAVESLLASGDSRRALTYYDSVKDKLDGADALILQARLKSTATDVNADDWIELNKPNPQRAQIRKFWEAKGYSPEAAAALTGNFQSESWTFDPMARNPGDGRDGSDSIGIGQWNGPRAKALVAFAKANGLDPRKVSTQLEFAAHELETSEASTRDALKAAKSLDEANRAAIGFFRPAGWTKDKPEGANSYGVRAQRALAALKESGGPVEKGDSKALVLAVANDPTLSKEEKTAVVQKLNQQSAAYEAWKAAETKSLEDNARVVLTTAMLDPSGYKDGTLLAYAERFAAVGKAEEAARFRILAAMESQLKTFMTSATDAQRATISELLKGLPKEIAEGVLKGDSRGRAEAKARGTEAMGVLQKAIGDNVAPDGLLAQAKTAIGHFNAAGDSESARKVAEAYENAVKARSISMQNPEAAARTVEELKTLADSGRATQQQLQLLDVAGETLRRQQAAFDKDAYAAGTDLYPNVGKPIPVNWTEPPEKIAATLQAKAQQARQIGLLRGGATVLPFSQPELAQLRQTLDTAPPDQQARILSTLASLPPDMVPRVAAALAGKSDTGDPLSRSYAAAMALYADRDPERAVVADQVLRGARLMKEQGDAGRKPATTSDAWQTALNDRLSNVFLEMGGRPPAVIADAVAAHYVWQMARAGKQGDKTDPDVLDKSITAIMGEAITRNGQAFLPPKRGMTRYEFDQLLGRLTDADLEGLRTGEGDPVTADVIRRRGVLTNVGDGVYKVRAPDGRRGGDLAEIVDPRTGRAWILDGKMLLERTPPAPARDPNAPDYIQAPPLARPRP